jgi:hypothetical protein
MCCSASSASKPLELGRQPIKIGLSIRGLDWIAVLIDSLRTQVAEHRFGVVICGLHRRTNKPHYGLRGPGGRDYNDSASPDVLILNAEHMKPLFEKVHPPDGHGRGRRLQCDNCLVGGLTCLEVCIYRANCLPLLSQNRFPKNICCPQTYLRPLQQCYRMRTLNGTTGSCARGAAS